MIQDVRKCRWKSLIHLQHKYFYEGNITYKYTGPSLGPFACGILPKTRTRLESPYSTVCHLCSNLRLNETELVLRHQPFFFF